MVFASWNADQVPPPRSVLMSKLQGKQTAKLPNTKKAKNETKYWQLALVAVLCASAWLFVIYLLPLPDAPNDSSLASQIPKPSADGASISNIPRENGYRDDSRLILPTETRYAGSADEKRGLLSEIERAIETYPSDPAILHIAGLVYAELQQSERAIELLSKSNQIAPKKVDVVVGLADLLMQVGKQEEVIAIVEKTISIGLVTEPLLSALGEAYSQSGQIDAAIKTLERAVAIVPSSPEQSTSQLRLSQALIQVGRFEEAEKYARESMLKRPSDLATYVTLSNALMRQNKREEAQEIRKQMPQVEPNVMPDDQKYELSFRGFASHNYAMLGAAFADHDAYSMAEKYFIRSLEIAPDSPKGAMFLADILRRQGRTKDAIAVYKRLIAIQPDSLLNYHNLASLAVSVTDLPLAENALRMAVNADSSGMADLQLAQFLLGVGSSTNLVSHARIAVDRLGTIDAYLVLIEACLATGDRTSAFDAYSKAKTMAPNDPRLANFSP